jgi:Zinc finger, C2H2 type
MLTKDRPGLSSDSISVPECCRVADWIGQKSGSLGQYGYDQTRLDSPEHGKELLAGLQSSDQLRHSGYSHFRSHPDQGRLTSSKTGSETGFDEISSWLHLSTSTTCYESGDSLDSFSTSTTTTPTFSLPPTPPATPPNTSQHWSPVLASPEVASSSKCGRFKCDSCPKVFGDRAHLAEHRRYRHSDDRPHRCPECSKGFKSRSNLNQHIRTTHEKKKFDCAVRTFYLFSRRSPFR